MFKTLANLKTMRRTVLASLLAIILTATSNADTITNWEVGFEVTVPSTWLRQEGGASGLKLASGDVKLDITPFNGTSLSEKIARMHKDTKADGYQFKTERSYTLHEVPAHEMTFYRDGKYLIYNVLMAGDRGILLTLRSEGTDSDDFRQAQDVLAGFRVIPLR